MKAAHISEFITHLPPACFMMFIQRKCKHPLPTSKVTLHIFPSSAKIPLILWKLPHFLQTGIILTLDYPCKPASYCTQFLLELLINMCQWNSIFFQLTYVFCTHWRAPWRQKPTFLSSPSPYCQHIGTLSTISEHNWAEVTMKDHRNQHGFSFIFDSMIKNKNSTHTRR